MAFHRYSSKRAKRVHAHKKRQVDRQALHHAVREGRVEDLPVSRKQQGPVTAWI